VTRDTAIAVRLFVAFVLVYLGTAKGILEEVDDFAMLRLTQAIVDNHSFAVPEDTPGASQGLGGQYFTRYGLGQSLIGIPFYLVGSALQIDVPTHDVFDPHGFVLATPLAIAMTLVGTLSTAATVGLLFLAARASGFSAAASVAGAVGLGLGTFAWFYARTFMSEPPSMLCALLGVYGMLRYPARRWLIVSGVGCGGLLLLRVGNAVLLPPLGLWLLWCMRSERSRDRSIGPILAWAIPIAVALVVIGAYNAVRFGSPLQTGYRAVTEAFNIPVLVGLYGLLLSPGKSVFLYAPITLAGAVGWFTLRRHHPALAWTVAAMSALYLLFYAGYDWWYGGGPWAVRFLTVILPFAGLGLAALLSRPLGPLGIGTIAALALASFAVQIVSVAVPYLPYDAVMEQDPVTFDRMLWHPAFSPLVVDARALLQRTYPPDFAFSYFDVPGLAALQLGLSLAGVAVLIACVRHASLSNGRSN
jgi:FtsH-binding integral membrane protein